MDLARLGIGVTSDSVRVGTDRLKRLGVEATKAEQKVDQLGDEARESGAQIQGLGKSTQTMGGHMRTAMRAVVALYAAMKVRDALQAADAMRLLQARVELFTDTAEDSALAMDGLDESAFRLGTDVQALGALFTRLAPAADQLGYSTGQLVTITNAVAASMAISGASAAESAGAIRQLSQAMASGVLRGQEFNSISENAPRLLQVLADSLDVNVGELRAMAEQGQLTAQVVGNALLGAADQLNDEFEQLPVTISRAAESLGNELVQSIANLNEQLGITSGIASAIQGMASGFRRMRLGEEFMDLDEEGVTTRIRNIQRVIDELALTMIPGSGVSGSNAARQAERILGSEAMEEIRESGALAGDNWAQAYIDALFDRQGEGRAALAELTGGGNGGGGGGGSGLPSVTKDYERTVEKLTEAIAVLRYARGMEREIVANLQAAGLAADDRTSEAAQEIMQLTETLARIEDEELVDEFVRSMDRQAQLLSVNAREADQLQAVLSLQEKATGDLTAAQIEQVRTSVAMNQALADQREILDQLNEPYERYAATTAAINELRAAGALSAEQASRLAMQAESELLQTMVDNGEATPFQGILAGLDLVAERSRNVAASMRDAFSGAFDSFASGAGRAFGRAIVFSEDLGDSLLDVAGNAMAQLIGSFVELGIQWVINKVIGESMQAATTASSVAQAGTVAAAWAPAAAAVSLASFGANAPAAMAGMSMTHALSQALSMMPGFKDGGFTGFAAPNQIAGVVHGQEGVLNARAMRSFGRENLDFMNRTGRMPDGPGGSPVVIDMRGAMVTREAVEDLKAGLANLRVRVAQSENDLPERMREIQAADYEMGRA